MAKATAECKCVECGTTFTKTKTCYNRTEANNWEQWAVDNYTQCPSCWGKEQRKKEEETPLQLIIDCDPFSQTIIFHFAGNSKPVKDQIKDLGYTWGDMPMHGFLGILETKRPPLCWYKMIKLEEMEKELQNVKRLNPVIKNNMTEIDIIAFANEKKRYEKEQIEKAKQEQEKQAKIDAIPKPKVPAKLAGHKWNQTIYGKKGNYTIYPDGVKTSITDDEKEEIDRYVIAKAEYKKAIVNV
jgi:DNA-directed RNA polymerase subunit RPC12/RpoP